MYNIPIVDIIDNLSENLKETLTPAYFKQISRPTGILPQFDNDPSRPSLNIEFWIALIIFSLVA